MKRLFQYHYSPEGFLAKVGERATWARMLTGADTTYDVLHLMIHYRRYQVSRERLDMLISAIIQLLARISSK
jgi:hypothetical protein